MTYFVTHRGSSERQSPHALDQVKDLKSALAHACKLIAEGHMSVTIGDGNGHNISDDDLAACCAGTKTISADLFK
jgi:hypothetical protein